MHYIGFVQSFKKKRENDLENIGTDLVLWKILF